MGVCQGVLGADIGCFVGFKEPFTDTAFSVEGLVSLMVGFSLSQLDFGRFYLCYGPVPVGSG